MDVFFFFNDTATTEIYTLSLHDALPICSRRTSGGVAGFRAASARKEETLSRASSRRTSGGVAGVERESTRLNSSHANISYAAFFLKKKKNRQQSSLTHS